MTTFLVMDGNNLLYRIIKGKTYPKLTTSSGIPTGGVYGFLQSAHKLYAGLFPDYGIVVFDGGISSRRKALYPAYKEYVADPDQEDVREEFYTQKNFISVILGGLGIPTIEFAGREADDVILHIVHYLTKLEAGFTKIVVVSEDMDLCQCIQCSIPGKCEVELHRPVRDLVLDRRNLDEHLGYPQQYYKWYKSLVGKTREFDGIPGIGKKTAIALINEAHEKGKTLFELVSGRKGKRYDTLTAQINKFYIGLAVGDLFLEEFTEDERDIIFTAIRATGMTASQWQEDVKVMAHTLELHSIVSEWASWTKPFMDATRR